MIKLLLSEAWTSLMANKLRAFLTMLGMIIGVSAVILMMAFGQGAKLSVQNSINAMGANLLIALSGSANSGGVRSGSGGLLTLSVNDAMAIKDLPLAAAVAPTDMRNVQIVAGPKNWNTQVQGTYPAILAIRDWKVIKGTNFTDGDLRASAHVAVIGQTVYTNLFNEGDDPIGQVVRLNNMPFRVIGLLEKKGQSAMGTDQDDVILVPLTAAQKYIFGTLFPGYVRVIFISATDQASTYRLQDEITDLLRQRHKIGPYADDDFSIRNLTAIAESAAQTANVLSYLLGAIASISLLVGGIGIMNIMLVSVTERTREIGIRLAIGAQKWQVLCQFLMEAMILSILGCALGVLIGVGGAIALNWFGHFSIVISGGVILLSFGGSFLLGVFFGVYPAKKASNLSPIDALRFQ